MDLAYKEKFGLHRERTKIQVMSKSSCGYVSGFNLYISNNVNPPRFLLGIDAPSRHSPVLLGSHRLSDGEPEYWTIKVEYFIEPYTILFHS